MRSLPVRLGAAALVRVACVFGLVSLLITALGVLMPLPLPVIASMSIGQGFGALAFICYLVAIVVEIARHDSARRELARRSSTELERLP